MWLVRIELLEPGKHERTFECRVCGKSISELAAFKWSQVRYGSKADMCSALAHFCFGPIAGIRSPQRNTIRSDRQR